MESFVEFRVVAAVLTIERVCDLILEAGVAPQSIWIEPPCSLLLVLLTLVFYYFGNNTTV